MMEGSGFGLSVLAAFIIFLVLFYTVIGPKWKERRHERIKQVITETLIEEHPKKSKNSEIKDAIREVLAEEGLIEGDK